MTGKHTIGTRSGQPGGMTDLSADARRNIRAALKGLLADVSALYLKTRNFHGNMSGPHFYDYHLLLDGHANQIFAMTDRIAKRARKFGGTTLRSIGNIARTQSVADNDEEYVEPHEMLAELRDDSQRLTIAIREVRKICDGSGDVVTTSLLEVRIVETEWCTSFLYEATRRPPRSNS